MHGLQKNVARDGNTAVPAQARPAKPETSHILHCYAAEFMAEVVRHARMPAFIVPALACPVVLYLALAHACPKGDDVAWLADAAMLAAIAPGLWAFGLSAAGERRSGFLAFKRALPSPIFCYFAAKLALCLLVTSFGILLLLPAALLTGHALPPAGGALRLMLAGIEAVPAFCALGLLTGSHAKGGGVVTLINLLLIPPALRFSHNALALTLANAAPALPLQSWFLILFALIVGALAHWRLHTTP